MNERVEVPGAAVPMATFMAALYLLRRKALTLPVGRSGSDDASKAMERYDATLALLGVKLEPAWGLEIEMNARGAVMVKKEDTAVREEEFNLMKYELARFADMSASKGSVRSMVPLLGFPRARRRAMRTLALLCSVMS